MIVIAILVIITIVIIKILNTRQIINIFCDPVKAKNIIGSACAMESSRGILTKLNNGPLRDTVSSMLSMSSAGATAPAPVHPITSPIIRKTDIPGTAKYQRLEFLRRSLHVGQLKLFLSEVQFLTNCAPIDAPAYVIYAGSGPGHTRQSLADMFPNLKFILIDPQEHNIMGSSPDSRLYFRMPRRTNFPHEVIHAATKEGIIKRPKEAGIKSYELLGLNQFVATIVNNPSYTFYIIEDIFTNEMAQEFRALGASGHTVLFISDIRTNVKSLATGGSNNKNTLGAPSSSIYDEVLSIMGRGDERDRGDDRERGNDSAREDSPHDIDIMVNNAWQHSWVHILHPTACMLKFRTPFMNPDDVRTMQEYAERPMYKDTLTDYKKRFNVDLIDNYIKGRYIFMANDHINLQAFPGPTSTETRLIAFPAQYNKCIEYKISEHEDSLFYYNLLRECVFTDRHKAQFNLVHGFDGCLDCDLAYTILDQYNQKFNASRNQSTIDLLRKALNMMHRTIKNEFHGNFFAPIQSVEQLQKLIAARTTQYFAMDALRNQSNKKQYTSRRTYKK